MIDKYQITCIDNSGGKEIVDRQNNQSLADFIRHKLYHMKTPIERILVSPLLDRTGYDIVFITGVDYEERT